MQRNTYVNRQLVVTYQVAYHALREPSGKTLDLCRKHRSDEAAGRPLGPVNHGEHRGFCDVCDRARATTA